MANLLVLLAVVIFVWAHPPKRRVVVGAALVFVLVQLVWATQSGITAAQARTRNYETSARLVINLDKIPSSKEACYALAGISVYVFPTYGDRLTFPGFTDASEDHLGEFAAEAARIYRAEGLPTIRQCDVKRYSPPSSG